MANQNNINFNPVQLKSLYGGEVLNKKKEEFMNSKIYGDQHRHELAAKERALAENEAISEIDTWIKKHNNGRGKILDVGGAALRHHRLRRKHVWSMCPDKSPQDSVRIAKARAGRAVNFCNCEWKDWNTGNGGCCAASIAFFAGHMPVAILMVHSIYYLSPDDIVSMVYNAQSHVPVYSVHHVFPSPRASLYGGEARYVRRADGTVIMYVEGNSVAYQHDACDWLRERDYHLDLQNRAMAWTTHRVYGDASSPTVISTFVKSPPQVSRMRNVIPYDYDPFADLTNIGPIDIRRLVGETRNALPTVWSRVPQEYHSLINYIGYSFGTWLILDQSRVTDNPLLVPKQAIATVASKIAGSQRNEKSFLVAMNHAKAAVLTENLDPLERSAVIPVVAALGFTRGIRDEMIAARFAINYDSSDYWSFWTWLKSFFVTTPNHSSALLNEALAGEYVQDRTPGRIVGLLMLLTTICVSLWLFRPSWYMVLALLMFLRPINRWTIVLVLLLFALQYSAAYEMDNPTFGTYLEEWRFLNEYNIQHDVPLWLDSTFVHLMIMALSFILFFVLDNFMSIGWTLWVIARFLTLSYIYLRYCRFWPHFQLRTQIILVIFYFLMTRVSAYDYTQNTYDPYDYYSFFLAFILSVFWRWALFLPKFRRIQDVCIQGQPLEKIASNAKIFVRSDLSAPCYAVDSLVVSGPANGPPPYMARSCVHNEYLSLNNRALKLQISPETGFWRKVMSLFYRSNLWSCLSQTVEWISYEQWISRFPPSKRAQLERAHIEAQSEDPVNAVNDEYQTFIKREHVLKYPFDPRTIQGTTFRYQNLTGPEVYSISKHLSKCFGLLNYLHPISVTYAGGLTAEAIGQWMDIQENRGLTAHVEADASRFDAAVSIDALNSEFDVYWKLGISYLVLILLCAQLNTRGVTKNGIKYKCTGTRKSGTNNTSVGNSLLNIIMNWYNITEARDQLFRRCGEWHPASIIVMGDDIVVSTTPMLAEVLFPLMVSNGKRFGFKVGVKVSPNPEFCSGCFWPLQSGYVFGPKPGRLLAKCFFLRSSEMRQHKILNHLKGLAECLMLNVNFIPVARAVFRKVLELLQFVHGIAPQELFRIKAERLHVADSETITFFCNRYHTTPTIVEWLERWINSQTTLFFNLSEAPGALGDLAEYMREIDTA